MSDRRCVSREEYRRLFGTHDSIDVTIRKQFAVDQIKAESERTYTFTISTGSVERDRDTIKPSGWRLDNFRKAGGPVLWAHQSRELPIGKSVWQRVEGDQLKARVEFAPPEVYPFADMVRGLIDFGALKSTSVGFLPIRSVWNEERMGFDFEEQELLEFSIVPVPSNPEAVQDAKGGGIDVAPLRTWAERVLDVVVEPGVWVPRSDLEQAFRLGPVQDPETLNRTLDFALAIGKRGRVLSAANEERIRAARAAGGDLVETLDAVLAQLEEEPAEAPKAPQRARITPGDVRTVTRAVLRELVRAEVQRLRGRID